MGCADASAARFPAALSRSPEYNVRMRLHLRDRQGSLVAAWRTAFSGLAGVEVSAGDIFDVRADAIVSPANSFGYMDGGIDLAYSERFGPGLQARLQRLLREEHFGELPVGQAVIVETLDDQLPFLVSAPTMRVPGPVPTSVNAYLAFRAALIAVKQHNAAGRRAIGSVLCPGLASAIGGMPPSRVAAQMRLAWDIVMGSKPWPPPTGSGVLASHARLTGE